MLIPTLLSDARWAITVGVTAGCLFASGCGGQTTTSGAAAPGAVPAEGATYVPAAPGKVTFRAPAASANSLPRPGAPPGAPGAGAPDAPTAAPTVVVSGAPAATTSPVNKGPVPGGAPASRPATPSPAPVLPTPV
ncbi:MAG: hypothetical protein FJX76_24440 [Armatimonadetes bacterium]|nr:hypothetical protein [Armatimonadota bacterium]